MNLTTLCIMAHTRFKHIIFDDLTSVALASVDDNRISFLLKKTVLDTSIKVFSSLLETQLFIINKLDEEPDLFENNNLNIYPLNIAEFKHITDSEYLTNKKNIVKLKLKLLTFMINNMDYMMNAGNFLLTTDIYNILTPAEQNNLNIETYAKNRRIPFEEAKKELLINLESRNFRLASIQGTFDYCIDKLAKAQTEQSILEIKQEFKSLFTLDLERLPSEGGRVR
jgi:hypothetical protein